VTTRVPLSNQAWSCKDGPTSRGLYMITHEVVH